MYVRTYVCMYVHYMSIVHWSRSNKRVYNLCMYICTCVFILYCSIKATMELNEVTPQYPPTHYPVITPKTDKPSATRSVTPSVYMCVCVCICACMYICWAVCYDVNVCT